jgi:WD40 repeat protein
LHRQGLVHRDIKPSNIIFVNGVPKLADIGLVADARQARSYVGTEGFIPPEGPGTPQADVYGLGKVLYEASTGRDRQDFPELPTSWGALSEQHDLLELNEVILHACKADPGKRYQSGFEMHADLVVLANGKSVKRLKLLERRLAALKRIFGATGLILLALGGVAYHFYETWRNRAELRQQHAGANVAYGNRAMEMGDLSASLVYFAQAQQQSRQTPAQGLAPQLRFGAAYAHCAKIEQLWSGLGDVFDVDFSADGRRVLALERHGKARVFSTIDGEGVSPPFGPDQAMWRGGFSPDGERVVTASEDGTACVWRVSDGAKILTLPHPQKVLTASFSKEGSFIVTGSTDNDARVWDARTGTLLLTLREHSKPILFAAFSPDTRFIVTTSRDGTVRLWDSATGQRRGPVFQHPTWASYAAFSPDGRRLATACYDHKARVWDLATGRRLPPDMDHDDGVNSVQFSPDGLLLATACLDYTVRLWRSSDHQPVNPNPILRHTHRVTKAVFCPEGRRLLTGCFDGTLRVWNLLGAAAVPLSQASALSQDRSRLVASMKQGLRVYDCVSGQPVSPWVEGGFSSEGLQLSAKGEVLLASAVPPQGDHTSNYVLHVYETATGRPFGPPLRLTNHFSAFLISPDGSMLFAFGGHPPQLWELARGRRLMELPPSEIELQAAAFSPAATALATWKGASVTVWDTRTLRARFPSLQHAFGVTHAEFSHDDARLVTCCAEQGLIKCSAQIWDASTGKPLGPPLGHSDGVLHATFSPDGRRVATAGEDFVGLLWNPLTGRQVTPPLRHRGQVVAVAFSPDSKMIVTASADKTARVWSAETGDPLTPPLRHHAIVASATFLPNGQSLVTSEHHGSSWLWRLPVDSRPPEDRAAMARLLAGDMITASGQLATLPEAPWSTYWKHLRERYSDEFTSSKEQIVAWHQFQARQSELEEEWFAAAFHLERLQAVSGEDPSLKQRLAQAKEHLSKPD